VGDLDKKKSERMIAEAGTNPEEIEEIYRMISLPTFEDRFVIPPFMREMTIESVEDPSVHKGEAGVGYLRKPKRGW
jgi:nitrate reductase beta subunit